MTLTPIGAPHPQPDRLFTLFRATALIEGVTTLALFLVAMPVKYWLGDPTWVKIVGPIHGYAFVAYIVIMVFALWGRGWGAGAWVRSTLASFYPFGTFINDSYLVRRKAQDDAQV